MEIERTQLKKTFFGNYRAEDVDKLLDDVEIRLQAKSAEWTDETGKIVSARDAAEKLSAELRLLKNTTEQLQEQNRRLSDECQTRREETQGLRQELDQARKELEEMRTELDLSNSQAAILSNRIARQRRELDEKDKLLLEDPVGEANKRAEQIIENATKLSNQMIDDAENMRSRALAAVRAAYFNTVGFRQTMEERISALQTDLDQSVRMLRLIEAEDEHNAPDFVQEKW